MDDLGIIAQPKLVFPIRLLICGDRNWTDGGLIRGVLEIIQPSAVEVVIHGACRGADLLADQAAASLGILRKPYPANWKEHGKAAGSIRNRLMLNNGKPNFVLAFHDWILESRGTADMLAAARKTKVPSYCISHDRPTVPACLRS